MSNNKTDLLKALSKGFTEGTNEFGEKYQAVQLLPELKNQYPTELKPEILSVRMYQTESACYLETTQEKNPGKLVNELDEIVEGLYSNKDYVTLRTSLSFITGNIFSEESIECYFRPAVPVLENAFLFLEEFDDESKLNCTDLFSKKGEEELFKRIDKKRSESDRI